MSIRKGSSIIAGAPGAGGGGSAMNVDNITTELNSSSEIQTIGVIEKNNSSPKYDWVGTETEWIAGRSDGSIEDDWICYIIDDNVASNKRQRTIGEIVYSLFPLTDVALHLLDGSVIDGTGVYNQFYTFMKNLYDNGYDKCFTTEADWQTSVTTYGVCGKFVLDTSNQTIRLPEVEGFIEGTLDEDAIGQLVEAGLPNITGTLSWKGAEGEGTGAFSRDGNSSFTNSSGISGTAGAKMAFNASVSNSIYGNSDTVQPQSIKGFYYIVLATNVDLTLSVDTDAIINDVTHLQTEVGGADYVVEWQAPTSENNYTWYRLYKSGWLEQGGKTMASSTGAQTVNLLKSFIDTNYTVTNSIYQTTTPVHLNDGLAVGDLSISSFKFYCSSTGATGYNLSWEAKGFAASSS